MPQYALAKAPGMSTSSINNMMKGKSTPYLYILFLICDALKVPAAQLLEDGYGGDNAENWKSY